MGSDRPGPWRFDGERYWPPPEMIPAEPIEVPELTEEEQVKAALTYIENRYGGTISRMPCTVFFPEVPDGQ